MAERILYKIGESISEGLAKVISETGRLATEGQELLPPGLYIATMENPFLTIICGAGAIALASIDSYVKLGKH